MTHDWLERFDQFYVFDNFRRDRLRRLAALQCLQPAS